MMTIQRRMSLKELANNAARSSRAGMFDCPTCGGPTLSRRDGAQLLCRTCDTVLGPAQSKCEAVDNGGGFVELVPRTHWQHRFGANEVLKIVLDGAVVGTIEFRDRRLMVVDAPHNVKFEST